MTWFWTVSARQWRAPAAGAAVLLILTSCGTPDQSGPQATQTAAVVVKQIAATAQVEATQLAAVQKASQAQAQPTVLAAASMTVATVQASNTQVAPTVSAMSSAVAATAETVPPSVAATAHAAATQIAAAIPPAVATSVAASPVQITSVTASPTDPYVTLRNSGSTQANVGGYVLLFSSGRALVPRNTLVLPGGSVNVHLAPGLNTMTDVYTGTGPEVMASAIAPGTRIVLTTPTGQIASFHALP